jgi:hypothetical protein
MVVRILETVDSQHVNSRFMLGDNTRLDNYLGSGADSAATHQPYDTHHGLVPHSYTQAPTGAPTWSLSERENRLVDTLDATHG